ncbi:MAG: hypothetical protein PHD97_06440 [Bacteroidales bacterium]|nr:hypothetical protein [Bacteroidales bacterium]
MGINRNNYEEYFLDFMEGNLTPGQSEELSLFLEQNFDLKEEFEQIVFVSLKPDENIKFSAKNILKKEETSLINETNYNNFLAAFIEGNLSSDDKIQLNIFLKENPKHKKEFEAIRKTILVPDSSIVFENKTSLKHFEIPFYKNVYTYASVAASIILLFGLYWIVNIKSINDEKFLSYNYTSKKPVKKAKPASKNNTKRIRSYTINNQPLIVKSSKSNLQYIEKESADEPDNVNKTNESVASLNLNKMKSKEPVIQIQTSNIVPQFINTDNVNVILPVSSDEIAQNNPAEKTSTLNKFYKKATAIFSENKSDDNADKNTELNPKASMWDLAFVGLKGYNRIFHKNVDMERKYYDNGNLASVVIKTEKFEYAKHYKEK